MQTRIFAVDSHTMGEPTRVVVGGLPYVHGKTMQEKRIILGSRFDHFRTALMHEPRGHKDMFGSILFEPTDPEADLGIVFMDGGGYLPMCGHGTIGAVTVALETGIIEPREPMTEVRLDTPAGLIQAWAAINKGRIQEITIRNLPAFLYAKDVKLQVPGLGRVRADIAFGGNFCALVDAQDLGLSLSPGHTRSIIETGLAIQKQINQEIQIVHPLQGHLNSVQLVEFCAPPTKPAAQAKNVVVFGAGQIDRSPCGTGTCSKMAALWAKGQLSLNQEFIHESIVGTTFRGRLVNTAQCGEFKAVIPEITAKAFILGFQQFVIDPEDPLAYGFLIE